MSQEKVNERKKYKKNRKQILAKEKRKKMVNKVVGYLCVIVLVGIIGFSVYNKVTPKPVADANTFYQLTKVDSYGILDPQLSK